MEASKEERSPTGGAGRHCSRNGEPATCAPSIVMASRKGPACRSGPYRSVVVGAVRMSVDVCSHSTMGGMPLLPTSRSTCSVKRGARIKSGGSSGLAAMCSVTLPVSPATTSLQPVHQQTLARD